MAYHSSEIYRDGGSPTTRRMDRDGVLTSALLYIIYFYSLSYAYTSYLYPLWEYSGFTLRDEPARNMSQALTILAVSLILPRKHDVRSYLLHILFMVKVIPSAVLYANADVSQYYILVIYAAFSVVVLASAVPLNFRTAGSIDPVAMSSCLLVLTFLLIVAIALSGGVRFFNLDISAVYDFRRDAARNFGAVINYLIPIFSKTVIPFGIVVSMIYRKHIILVIFMALSIVLFGYSHHKGILFYPFITFGIYFFMARSGSLGYIKLAMVFAIALGLYGILVQDGGDIGSGSAWSWYVSLLVRRALMVPALLDSQYIEFFSENPWYLWSGSRLSLGLVERAYDVTPPLLIGESYYSSLETSANTGFIGSGFAQMGLWGAMIYSLGVGAIVSFLNAMGNQKGVPFTAAMVSVQMLTMFISTDFVTMFMTHGMLATMLILLLIDRPKRPLPSKESAA